ncbi:vacuolar carboxypeptidase [Ophiostoma piceae UAMH 11346]|uniref:Vacuolar carboxypeptidase n=1 Tax=Ophiostoma piceae (strain UAMH 11346) TaxID=1262450 RepID=S3D3W4_OPHP1|nr:vacuolar carboxypeptidase [Ophiostoma piceae UAMH 11346]
MDKQALLQALDNSGGEHVRLLQTFVQAPSPNPPGDTLAAAAVITAYLVAKKIPYEIVTDIDYDHAPNIVSEFTGGLGSGPRVILNGHLDVFPVIDEKEWKYGPWSGHIAGDRLYGRGVVDMKSGTVSLVAAYAALFEKRHLLRGSVMLCAVSDEEVGGKHGTAFLLRTDPGRYKGDVMLSAEPGGCGSVRFAEKGTLRMRCVVHTKGAHGAYTNLSPGAVRTAAALISDIVAAVEGMDVQLPAEMAKQLKNKNVLDRIDDVMGPGTSEIIAKPTVNVGTIQGGGEALNVIPDRCDFTLDIRMPVGLTREDVLPLIRKQADKHEVATVELAVVEAASNPASYSAIGHSMVGLLADNAGDLLAPEGQPKPLAIPSMGATDCKHYRYAGVSAYDYGCSPFSMAQVNESASIREFLHVAKVHAAAVWDYLR